MLEYIDDSVGEFLLRDRLEKARARAVHAAVDGEVRELGRLLSTSGLTQRELARRIGTSKSRLSTWLGGKQTPSMPVIAKIRLALASA